VQSRSRAGSGAGTGAFAGCAARRAITGCALASLVLTACGSSAASTNEPNSARLAPAIALNGTLVLNTPYALIARFTDNISTAATAGATCADAAKGFLQDGVRYEPPHNPQGETFNTLDGHHHTVTITLHVAGYQGPATYGKPSIFGDDGLQLLKVDGFSYGTFLGGDITVRVATDNSGQLSFASLVLTPPTPAAATPTPSGTPPPRTPKPTPAPAVAPLTGMLTWTCVQIRAPTPTPTAAAAKTPAPTPKH
jgi:hypothetical protein